MKRLMPFLVIGAMLGLLAGCAELFQFNIFDKLDRIKLPDLSTLKTEMGTDEILDLLSEETESDSFLDALGEDPDKEDEIRTYLDEVASNGSSSDEQKQRALAMKGDLTLAMSPAGVFLDNAAALVTDPDFDFSDLEAAAPKLLRIVPAEVLEDFSAFEGMLEDFSDADEAYEALGGVLGGSTPSSEINWGRTAQNALVSYVVQSLRDQGMSNQELFDAAHGGTVDFSGLTSPFDGVNDTHVTEILDAAGMGGLLA